MRGCAVVLLAAALAGCGGSGSHGVEAALSGGEVAGYTVSAADCAPSDKGVPGSFDCRVEESGEPAWLLCFRVSGESGFACARSNAPVGTPVFTTPLQMTAPKDVSFKCEDEDEAGREIGPVFISIHGAADGPTEELDWMTKAEARKVAVRYETELYLDC